jgi:hypothetical protein
MMKIQGEFDPLAVVIDWLDACRSGGLVVLLDLYDNRAILECGCERLSLTGRNAIAAYWEPKLGKKLPATAFTLDEITMTDDGVRIDYQSYEGKPVRIHFRFGPSGRILHTRCRSLELCTI